MESRRKARKAGKPAAAGAERARGEADDAIG
jgi:hypothetical protein